MTATLSPTTAGRAMAKRIEAGVAARNLLYFGDNLGVLREHIDDESVDLIYLDPPFNSQADYNVLFAERDGSRAAAQIKAFGDTWHWDVASATAFEEFVESAPRRAGEAMEAFRMLFGDSDMLAYLAMMAPRLVELRRILKPTGSIYLHCDPTASHYLKILMDAIFGPEYLCPFGRRVKTVHLIPGWAAGLWALRRRTVLPGADTDRGRGEARPVRRW